MLSPRLSRTVLVFFYLFLLLNQSRPEHFSIWQRQLAALSWLPISLALFQEEMGLQMYTLQEDTALLVVKVWQFVTV